jgi:hypothetical protein
MTLVEYGSIADPHSSKVSLIQESQEKFAHTYLDSPTGLPSFVATAILGLPDVSLVCIRKRVLLLHRVLHNQQDKLTPALVHLPIRPDGSSFLTYTYSLLAEILPGYQPETFLRIPYPQAAALINSALPKAQQTIYDSKLLASHPEHHPLKFSSPTWGFDPFLLAIQPHRMAIDHLSFKSGLVLPPYPQATPLSCALCQHGLPTLSHLFFDCPAFERTRDRVLACLSTCPSVRNRLVSLDQDHRMYFLLGHGQRESPSSEWKSLIPAVVSHTSNIVQIVRRATIPEP